MTGGPEQPGSSEPPGAPDRGPADSGAPPRTPSSLPIDPDVDLRVPAQRAETAGAHLVLVVAAVAAGGAVGALARYAVVRARPADDPLATLAVNLLGSFLIGVLMVLVAEGGRNPHPLIRPFAGTGVLGGFTTFSAYALDIRELLAREQPLTAFGYLAGTLVGCLGAVWAAVLLTRRAGAGDP
ncbi:CrcB family protein [Streptomyces sp. NPDC006798]|uniref:fluoride efflux transporter FluC n=1 Tax=Streptomyces sp. NPDC006798 TaxID=3155462 RepID=UPI0033C54A1B